ncbi:MAG: sodium:proton antiporter [Bacteroidia bacterium]|nr:sodium:proton antiporter [Bacteroidia bacterium]
MDNFFLITILVSLCALFSFINVKFLKLPAAIGLMVLALGTSLLISVLGHVSTDLHDKVLVIVKKVNFTDTLFQIMLSFLLFAGSLHVSLREMKKQRAAVISFSSLGVALSVFLFGSAIYYVFILFGYNVDLIYCLLFGALISPTDPIAILGILRGSKLPKEIEVVVSGESLFNDGMGVVFFVTIYKVIEKGISNLSAVDVALLFGQEVFGGLLLGLALGFIAFQIIKRIDHYQTEVMISLALVMICNELAAFIGVSGPLAAVVIGLYLGNKVRHSVMSDTSREYHDKFWELIDEFLNAMLFMLIGLQMVLLPFLTQYIFIGVIGIVLLLVCRYLSLMIPIFFIKDKKLYNPKTAVIMTWGGLRGGISVGLALGLPEGPYKEVILSTTYIIVIFSIIVQGLTTGKLVKWLYKEGK